MLFTAPAVAAVIVVGLEGCTAELDEVEGGPDGTDFSQSSRAVGGEHN